MSAPLPFTLAFDIEKTDNARNRVDRSTYRGQNNIDVRTLIHNDAGVFYPPKKGTTLSPEMLPTFINAPRQIQQEGGE